MTKKQQKDFDEMIEDMEFRFDCTILLNHFFPMEDYAADNGFDLKEVSYGKELMRLKKALEFFAIEIREVK